MNSIQFTGFWLIWVLMVPACVDDAPDPPPLENEEEIITDVILTFTPLGGGSSVKAFAVDPDGQGPMNLEVGGTIVLNTFTDYIMTIDFENALAGESITEEVREEADEHRLYFEWTEGLFQRPMGNGNTDNVADPVIYNDMDVNELPLGLSTTWETGAPVNQGIFRIVLKHQPGIKSNTTEVRQGDTDLDLVWSISII